MNNTTNIKQILANSSLDRADIVRLLQAEGDDLLALFQHAAQVKKRAVGNKVYLRGLIEYSNICKKNCYYCGIRSGNPFFQRYRVSSWEIIDACNFAMKHRFGSMVLQCGELQSDVFTKNILDAIRLIKDVSGGLMRITLSCGEQKPEVYKAWFDAGAERYLLRIEASNPELYKKLHPQDQLHHFENRINALKILKEVGFQTGTGVMIGLPFQTLDDLADDLLFMQKFEIDMCGMGPYIEHEDTPLYEYRNLLLPLSKRYELALKMIALLRILMPDINIASTTALQAIDPNGKRNALEIGANVIMPNITPSKYKSSYHLYQNKPGRDLRIEDELQYAISAIKNAQCETAFGEYGDAMHFLMR